eukprot:355368-Chlamydomonas_euryale.AAC.6
MPRHCPARARASERPVRLLIPRRPHAYRPARDCRALLTWTGPAAALPLLTHTRWAFGGVVSGGPGRGTRHFMPRHARAPGSKWSGRCGRPGRWFPTRPPTSPPSPPRLISCRRE